MSFNKENEYLNNKDNANVQFNYKININEKAKDIPECFENSSLNKFRKTLETTIQNCGEYPIKFNMMDNLETNDVQKLEYFNKNFFMNLKYLHLKKEYKKNNKTSKNENKVLLNKKLINFNLYFSKLFKNKYSL